MGRWLSKRQRAQRDGEIIRLRTQYSLTHQQIARRIGVGIAHVGRVLQTAREEVCERKVE